MTVLLLLVRLCVKQGIYCKHNCVLLLLSRHCVKPGVYCKHDCVLLLLGRLCVKIETYCNIDCVLICFSAPLRMRLTGRVTQTSWPYSPPTSSCLVTSHSHSDSMAIVSTAHYPKCWYTLKLYLCNVWFSGVHSIPDNVWHAVNCNLWHIFNTSSLYSLWTERVIRSVFTHTDVLV